MSVPLSDLSLEVLRKVFLGDDQPVARKLIEEGCGSNLPFRKEMTNPKDFDRVRIGVMKISNGSVERLRKAIELAQLDERDLLMAAGFGYNINEHLEWVMNRIPILEAFKDMAPVILQEFAEEIQSRLVVLESSLYEIEKASFCLRVYLNLAERGPITGSYIVIEIIDLVNRTHPLFGFNGSVGLHEIADYYGEKMKYSPLFPATIGEEIARQLTLVRKYCFTLFQGLQENEWMEIKTKKFGKIVPIHKQYWDVTLPPTVKKIWNLRKSLDKLRKFKSFHRLGLNTISCGEEFKITHLTPAELTYNEGDKGVTISIERSTDGQEVVSTPQRIEKWMKSDGTLSSLDISDEKQAEIVSNANLVLEYEFFESLIDMRELLIDVSSKDFPETDWSVHNRKSQDVVTRNNKTLIVLIMIIVIIIASAIINILSH